MESEFITLMKFKEVNSEKVEEKYIKITEKTNIPTLPNFQTCSALKAVSDGRRNVLLRNETLRIQHTDCIFQIEICLQFWSYQFYTQPNFHKPSGFQVELPKRALLAFVFQTHRSDLVDWVLLAGKDNCIWEPSSFDFQVKPNTFSPRDRFDGRVWQLKMCSSIYSTLTLDLGIFYVSCCST